MFEDYHNLRAKQNQCKKFVLIIAIITLIGLKGAAASEEKDINGKSLQKAATFHFPEYAYKETSKNEIIYREFEATCEQKATCEGYEGVAKIGCLRRCVSNSCYMDIYAFDELEAGEIDVRLNSFKGCVIQRTGHCNHLQQQEGVMKHLRTMPMLYHEFRKQFDSLLKFFY